MSFKFIPICIALCLSLACTQQSKAPDQSFLNERLADSLHVKLSAGLAFAAYAEGQLIETGAFGLADIASGRPMRPETPLRLASITKPIAAALILDADKNERLHLDQSLWVQAPEFSDKCVRLQNLFAQRGLPFLESITCRDPNITLRRVLTHTASAPDGDEFSYNGFLYGRLAEPLSRANSGASMEHIIRERVITPLALSTSAAGIADKNNENVIQKLARPHRLIDNNQLEARPYLEDDINPGAGMMASAPDDANIFMSLISGELFSKDIVNKMMDRPTLKSGEVSPYGHGVFIEMLEGRTLLWHTGWQPGAYSAIWVHDIESRSGLIILSNTDLQAATGDFSGTSLENNALAGLFLEWLRRNE